MINFNIVTLFPDLFTQHFNNLPFKRAVDKGLASYNLINLRNFAIDARGSVDDKPYGGGVGMVLMPEPIFKALESLNLVKNDRLETKEGDRVILLSPRGKRFTQSDSRSLSKAKNVSFICGRYEGVDARIETNFVTDVFSVGDYVLSGGELPALTIMESITRLLPGVLEKEDATTKESFDSDSIEHPQYTRPEDFKGLKVPEVLMSGNHKEIEAWKKSNSPKIQSY